MKGFMTNFKANESKEKAINKIDAAIEKARAEMEMSIAKNPNLTSEETVKLSQKLDPLIAHKQRMMIYGCSM
ncbi:MULTISPECIES: aspartyl-phosphate phosphatase Spo0E family protein [unclassified Clostridium]|uniref:aspartyl-phosphate phosphatase Spo0E family protein n=1 Tax=unclassified Clostridium TaxID=2614128 RepID=UPI0002977A17|nr:MULTISPECIES: aspartyl-phosphate phosphatase Spo0E family protein [unclassified Clostridium]EKQ56322.1 MAG: Spo0E like sporulation regulatory protein [Clostridium sp. Maddingley MBC34-26]